MGGTVSIRERILSVRQLQAALHTPAPPFPRSAKIELTSRCDLHCYFCASHRRPRRHADMSPKLYRRIARELRQLGVDQLGLFYIGESFLCEGLPDAISYAKNVCRYPHVFLTTNGLKATPERVRACMLARLDSLKVRHELERGAVPERNRSPGRALSPDSRQRRRRARDPRRDRAHDRPPLRPARFESRL